jgi:ketosteroid isomerase-like protein
MAWSAKRSRSMQILVLAISLAILALGSVPTRADDAETIAAVNAAAEALDRAFEEQDAKAIAALMTPDHVAVTPYYDGPQSTAEQIASLPDLDYAQENLDEPKVTLLGPDAAMRTFSAGLKGTYKGRPIPSPVFVTAMMVRKDGKWLEKFYQVTRIAGERMGRRGACRELAGTYLTRNSAKGGFTSRSLLSFDRGGLVFFGDSGGGGELSYAPFSSGQGAWQCVTNGEAIEARAIVLDFTFPKTGEADAEIGRLDFQLVYKPETRGIEGTAILYFMPLKSEPLKVETLREGREFKIDGERVDLPPLD